MPLWSLTVPVLLNEFWFRAALVAEVLFLLGWGESCEYPVVSLLATGLLLLAPPQAARPIAAATTTSKVISLRVTANLPIRSKPYVGDFATIPFPNLEFNGFAQPIIAWRAHWDSNPGRRA